MPNITSADVGYATVDAVVSAPGRTRRRVTLTLPTSASNTTYPAGGVPLLGPNLVGNIRGLVAAVKVLGQTPIAGDTNPVWGWNGSTTAPKLVAFQGGSVGTAPLREFTTTIAQNAAVVFLEVEGG